MSLTEETRIDAVQELLGIQWREDRSALYGHGVAAIPGVHPYRAEDGRIIRELVDDAVLADPEYLASVARSPITLEHPPVMVTPDNAAQYIVGDADGEAEIDDRGYVRVKIAARTRPATDALERKQKAGLSMGYPVTIDNTPGVHPKYGPYDRRQVKRGPNNHIAICDSPRHGDQCSIRVDAYEVPPMDPKILTLLRTFTHRDSLEESGAPSVLESLLAELGRLREDACQLPTMTKALADANAQMGALQAKLDEFMAKEKAAGEAAAQMDAKALADKHKVTLTATDSAGMRREVVKSLFQVDADDTTLPGLWTAAKAYTGQTERLIVTDSGSGADKAPDYRTPYDLNY
jgi:hypothetical protein